MSLRAIAYITSSTALDTGYDTFLIDASGGNITFTMNEIGNDGETYMIKRTDNSSNTVTVQGFDSSQTIDGQTSISVDPGVNFTIMSRDNDPNSTWVIFD